ncbi:rim15, signal transduction response regulator, partial [Ascosphaera acerosa]
MSTTAWPSSKHTSVKNTGFRSLSESIRAEREDLREAAEHTRNVILDLGLDGRVKWVSPSWTTIIGTLTKGIEGCDIRDILVDDKDVFTQAVKELQRDDSRSQMVRIMVKLGPLSIFWADEAISEDTEDEKEQVNRDCDLRGGEHSSGQQEKAETIADVTETATRN